MITVYSESQSKVCRRTGHIKEKRLEWTGHVVRMNHGRKIKKIFESKPEGSRRRGRPRLRWLEGVERDVREMKATKGNR